ncbi:hypothetical protein [Imhoffiella purpurea]|uniref:Type II secretion system protein GspC N-terminal domain-containing protein n=1 Tax=Imhoffiella purpurea TaxID=1249627 RepID=W9VJC7_9GAMM|nr:hypothetical protein [Imhoffiella purpurea]EXJ17106.1 hypothetical protein D779_0858 [Imhoffiella purpurea]
MIKSIPGISIPGAFLFLLLGILVLQWRSWPPPASEPSEGESRVPVAAPDSSTSTDPSLIDRLSYLDDKEHYAIVMERPLFRPDRRPLPPDDPESEAPSGPDMSLELGNLDLTAVLITPSLTSAWIKDPAQPKLQRLRIGDDYAGWSVREIQEDRVLLERQGERHALILRDYSKTPPSSTTTVPAKQRPRPIRARKRPDMPSRK